MNEKEYIDHEIGRIVIRKSPRARRLAIRVLPRKGPVVIIPQRASYSDGEDFFKKNKPWVIKTLAKIASRIEELENELNIKQDDDIDSRTNGIIEDLRWQAKEFLPGRLQELADKYGFKYNRLTIKHNTSNWGSCSKLGNINLNLNLMRVPAELQDYVMLHELCHLRYMNHGSDFHKLLEKLCREEIGLPEKGIYISLKMAKQLNKYILI